VYKWAFCTLMKYTKYKLKMSSWMHRKSIY